ncbi:hypothetical protein GGI10_003161 [Coemansia sp. RSA 2530]|nr:hypothetical protein GGI10_003161 [Coemansia sp. RSA 2530]
MDDLLRTPRNESRKLDDDLSLQSPPMLAQTPRVGHSAGSPDEQRAAVFAKRTIAEVATPRKPGSVEARVQEESAYINSPARAPPSTKRLMRSESPLGFKISLGHEEPPPDMLGEVVVDYDNGSQPQSHTGAADPSTPNRGSANAKSDSLISVTPANQRLLDSLEIQWVSPRRVPKFSEVDMEDVRTEYEDKMRRQNELREMLLEALKEEYAANMRKQEDMADQALREAEELFQKHAAQREREFEERLRAAEANHLGEIARRDEDTRVQEAQLSREIENLITERADISNELAQTRQTLEEYVATSGRLMDEKDSEINGLTRELAKLTLDRQRLQEQLGDALKSSEELFAKHSEALQVIEVLEVAKKQSDELNNTLHHDVLVSEERAAKIKEYAEGKLGEANAEISSAHEQLAAVRQDAAALKAQATKSDARARSLQIQLDSTKRQNEELLALCERLEGSF